MITPITSVQFMMTFALDSRILAIAKRESSETFFNVKYLFFYILHLKYFFRQVENAIFAPRIKKRNNQTNN